MTVKAWLVGRPGDLERLARLFDNGPCTVRRDETGEHYLTADPLDAAWNDGGLMVDISSSLLEQLNGVARLLDPASTPVELSHRFSDEAGSHHVVAFAGLASATAFVASATLSINGVPQTPSPPPADHYLRLGDQHPDVKEVFALMSKEKFGFSLQHDVFEVVRANIGGLDERIAQPMLLAKGWVSKDDLTAFLVSANSKPISGDAARHVRGRPRPTPYHMTERQGQELIRGLVQKWLDSF